MKRVVHYSGGLCSFWAAKRVKDRYGPDDMVLLFADTCAESDDLYRFVAVTSDYLGVPVTRLSREMMPWELFRKEGMIGNSRSPLCSVKRRNRANRYFPL